jgi:AraC-like DNA-binding protein
MDGFSALLNGPRAQQAFLLQAVFEPPWGLDVRDEAPLTIVVMLSGEAWLQADDLDDQRLGPGEVGLIRGPDHYTMSDQPDTPMQVIVNPDQSCTTIDGEDVAMSMLRGVRTWGNNVDGQTRMLIGTYNLESEVSQRLLRALPRFLSLRQDEWDSPYVGLLAAEMVKERPGQDAVLDRLLDLVLMSAIRAWFELPNAQPPGWYLAESDPAVGDAIRLLHHDPSYPWTVAELASAAGMSRASLARRFTEVVGEPPLTFLTNWRITLAADLLAEPGVTIGAVAEQVGYSTPYALSAAFKRVRGVSPKEHRAALAS